MTGEVEDLFRVKEGNVQHPDYDAEAVALTGGQYLELDLCKVLTGCPLP